MTQKAPYNYRRMGRPWATGVIERLPWLGLTALIGVLFCSFLCIVVLTTSDGKVVEQWPTRKFAVQPAVFLVIFTTIANSLLAFALAQGACIAWWRKALKGGTMYDLHRYWQYGVSLGRSLISFKHCNRIALGCMATALIFLDGPLVQKASTISSRPFELSSIVSVNVSRNFLPDGFSGYINGRGADPNLLTSQFRQVMQDYNARSPIRAPGANCTGVCQTTIQAAGFDISCNSSTSPYVIFGPTQKPGDSVPIMATKVQFAGLADNGLIIVNSTYKRDPGCSGDLIVNYCVLRRAKVQYPITIDSNGIVTLPPYSPSRNDTVQLDYQDLRYDTHGMGNWPTTIGGIWLAASQLFDASAMAYFSGAPWTLIAKGAISNTYINSNDSSYGNCGMTWKDPTPDILNSMREMVFRSAIAASNSSNIQNVPAAESITYNVYISNYSYLAGTLAVMIVSTLLVVPTFLGWWDLGRQVSLSPIEIAKAFNAPLLHDSGCNIDVQVLLKEVGDRKVRYGEMIGSIPSSHVQVEEEVGALNYNMGQTEMADLRGGQEGLLLRLGMASPEAVIAARKWVSYSG